MKQSGKVESGGPDLWQVIAPLCAAASLGVLAAGLASVRRINPELVLRFDLLSVVVGGAAAAAGWWIARGLWRLDRSAREGAAAAQHRLRRRVVGGILALGLLILGAFAISIATIPESRRWDMILGGLLAAVVLGAIGLILLFLGRLFGGADTGEDT